jgi:hypothetical protein
LAGAAPPAAAAPPAEAEGGAPEGGTPESDARSLAIVEASAALTLAREAEQSLVERARTIFNATDTDGNGSISRDELFAKLRADDEIEALLGKKSINTRGSIRGMKKMGRILVEFDADAQEGMGEGLNVVSWKEFEKAVRKAHRHELDTLTAAADAAFAALPAADDVPETPLPPLPPPPPLRFRSPRHANSPRSPRGKGTTHMWDMVKYVTGIYSELSRTV